MPKSVISFLLAILSLNALAQLKRWEYGSKYTANYMLASSEINEKYFEEEGHPFALIENAADLQKLIDEKLAHKIFAVNLQLSNDDDLTKSVILLKQFNKLEYLNLTLTIPGTFKLPQAIVELQQLQGVEFNTETIDMDDALKKLASLNNLHVISFSKYKAELPHSITGLEYIDSIKLNTTNIGNNKLSGLRWKKVRIIGNPDAWNAPTEALTKAEEHSLLSLASINTLRQIYFDDIKFNNPSIIKRFNQITDLRALFEGDDDPEAFLIALSSLNNVHTLYLNLFYDRSISLNWIANMPQLQDVFIGGTDHPFKSFEALGQLVNLESLTLHQFALGAMPDIFGKLSHLKTLQLTLNGITKVPAGLFNLPALENLDLTANSLTYLPPLLSYGCNGLKHVNLMMNQLTSLPAAFSGLQNLETLNCSNNKIETIPGGWAYLTHLKEVNFGINHLTEFPEGLQNNHSVERITLLFNKIETFPDVDGEGYKLRYLGITGNRNMFALPEHIGAYTQLDTLEAQYLHLSSLPESLGDCKQLKMLLLSRSITKKTILPSGLKDARNLQVLELNDNPLLDHRCVFDVILSQPRSNLRINLSNCDIRQLPSTGKWLSIPFVSMSLRDNPISELPKELINSKVKGTIDTKGTNIHP